mmetsp:Transcript_17305/g.49420  ORF Transcript_17305/g.49420 Transcript_17305/m.49420 type:complete len:176 (+) Transcript_17305:1203-1730(+)
MADRLGASKDEIDAVNAQLGVLGREFSDFVLAAAARDESLPFSLQFWDPTGGLDARIHRVTDIASLVDDDEYNHWGDWTDTALKSQLYGALQYGARLLTDDPSLVLADEVDSSCFRNFVDRRNKYNLSGYDWTIWFGLDYRLTYTHPITKRRIVICPQVVRDELRARAAAARSDA